MGAAEPAALQALIWDVDGTLADTEFDGHRIAFNRVFVEEGLDWHWDEETYARLLLVTGGKERMLAWWSELHPRQVADADVRAMIARLHQRKTAYYIGLIACGAVRLRPGVEHLLHEARAAGLRQAIATTTTVENVTALLRATLGEAAPTWFEVIGAGDVVDAKKPDPAIYRWVLERLALPPSACLAIEDSGPGTQSAVAAGVPVLLTRCRWSAQAAIDGPVVADVDGLEGVVLRDLVRWHAGAVAR